MVDVAKVFMYGLPVGTFRWDNRYDVAQFEYDSDFVGRGIEPSPLMNESGVWKLSPAYDVGYAYNPHGGWTATHQMSINNKFDNIIRKDLLECAALNNIKNASELIDEVCETVAAWPTIAKECEVPQQMIDTILPNLLLTI